MATDVMVNQKIVLAYQKGSYSFPHIALTANREAMYNLAGVLNSFQSEKPFAKVKCVETAQIV